MRQDYINTHFRYVTNLDARARIEARSRILFSTLTNNVTPEQASELRVQRDQIRAQLRLGILPASIDENAAKEARHQKTLREHVQTYDLDGDGVVTFEEEAAVLRRRSEERPTEYFKERSRWFLNHFGQNVFNRFDINGNGVLEPAELASASRICIEAESALAPKCDRNNDGVLDPSERTILVEEVKRFLNEQKERELLRVSGAGFRPTVPTGMRTLRS